MLCYVICGLGVYSNCLKLTDFQGCDKEVCTRLHNQSWYYERSRPEKATQKKPGMQGRGRVKFKYCVKLVCISNIILILCSFSSYNRKGRLFKRTLFTVNSVQEALTLQTRNPFISD